MLFITGNVGTVQWIAPEVLSEQRYRFPADVYSLGMVLYEMATGLVPFQGMVTAAVITAVVVQKKQPEIPPSANTKMVEIIKRFVPFTYQLLLGGDHNYYNHNHNMFHTSSCIEWDPDNRSPLNNVMTELAELVPEAQDRVSEPFFQQHDRCVL